MGRKYNFDLPITIGHFQASFVPGILKDEGIWDKIPEAVQDKFVNSGWGDVVITEEDLNSLDNASWKKLQKKFTEYGLTT